MHHKRRSRRRDTTRWASCGCCPIVTPGKEPIEDGPCTGTKRLSKRQRSAKEKCPANRVHEWYVERVTEHHEWIFSDHTYEWDTVEDIYTCIHCWKVKTRRVRQSPAWRSSPNRKLRVPKRPVAM